MNIDRQKFLKNLFEDGLYSCDESGNIYSHYYQGKKRASPKILNHKASQHNGYHRVTLFFKKSHKTFTVHLVVYLFYNGKIKNGFEVNHINGNKSDNAISNLEQVSRANNMRHAYSIGLNNGPIGEKNWSSKLNESDIHNIRLISKKIKTSKIALMYSVSQTQINNIISKRRWSHI